jgi:hypothetical protein
MKKENKKILTLNGTNLTITETQKSIEKKQKMLFLEIVGELKHVVNRSDELHSKRGINLAIYEDKYFQMIEGLMIEAWGLIVSEVVFWWVYEINHGPKEEHYLLEKETNIKHPVKTTSQLYKLLVKLKKFKNQ